PTFKKTFGYHPLGVWCDNTQEFVAAKLRTGGSAGSNTTADHIDVLTDAITQIPSRHRKNLLIRGDGAGASHGLLDWIVAQGQVRGRTVEYSVGFAVTEKLRDAIRLVPKNVWTPALDADGGVRDGGDVAELTGLLETTMLTKGLTGCGSSSAGSVRIRVRSCRCSKRPTGGATKRSQPTPRSGSSPSWKPGTAPTPASRTASATPRTPDSAASRRDSSRSTRPGSR
ncbi:transposase, partial [Mumia flava]|uniref:transposase n=1 Tax=Mumia flava TaxID=1348852 RepID=UPI001B802A88